MLAHPWQSGGHGGSILAPAVSSWPSLGSSQPAVGPMLTHLWPSWGHDGSILAPTWPPWRDLGTLFGHVKLSLGPLGSSWAPPGCCWNPVAPLLSPCLARGSSARAKWGPCWSLPVLCLYGTLRGIWGEASLLTFIVVTLAFHLLLPLPQGLNPETSYAGGSG